MGLSVLFFFFSPPFPKKMSFFGPPFKSDSTTTNIDIPQSLKDNVKELIYGYGIESHALKFGGILGYVNSVYQSLELAEHVCQQMNKKDGQDMSYQVVPFKIFLKK